MSLEKMSCRPNIYKKLCVQAKNSIIRKVTKLGDRKLIKEAKRCRVSFPVWENSIFIEIFVQVT